MYRSIDLAVSEQRPDHSRYAYNISASYFTPAPADVELDKAIAGFAALGLNGVAGMTGPLGQSSDARYLGDPYSEPRNNEGRVYDRPYPGSYAGSMADGYYGQGSIAPPMRPSPIKAIDYPRSMINGPSKIDGYGGSRVSSSRHHHSSRKSRHGGSSTAGSQYYQDLQPVDEFNNTKAMVKYATGKKSKSKSKRKRFDPAAGDGAWDVYDDVEPEDSISQVSSRMSSRYGGEGYEPSGRTRRRDGSVVSRSTVVPGRGQYSMGGGGGAGEEFYYTREVTPW